MVGVPGRSKACLTCRRRRKGVRTPFPYRDSRRTASAHLQPHVKLSSATGHGLHVRNAAQLASSVPATPARLSSSTGQTGQVRLSTAALIIQMAPTTPPPPLDILQTPAHHRGTQAPPPQWSPSSTTSPARPTWSSTLVSSGSSTCPTDGPRRRGPTASAAARASSSWPRPCTRPTRLCRRSSSR